MKNYLSWSKWIENSNINDDNYTGIDDDNDNNDVDNSLEVYKCKKNILIIQRFPIETTTKK